MTHTSSLYIALYAYTYIYSMYYHNVKICIVDLTEALLGPNELFVEVEGIV